MNYFLTSIYSKDFLSERLERRLCSTRTFGYFRSLDNAMDAIDKNAGDMEEFLYDYLILEQIGEGIHPIANKVILFEWKDNKWTEVKMWPKWLDGMTNFALG